MMTTCYACHAELVPDNCGPAFEPVTYQFDNALWIAFHGGYGMFVDNLEAKLPTNTEDRWLRDANGEYIVGTDCICDVGNANVPLVCHEFKCPCRNPIDNPDWEPEYREERMLPGHPDYEAVICHDCAHAACEALPWLAALLNPPRSHAHRTDWKNAHPDHYGWDYKERSETGT